jgi:hypothetical protein
MQKITQKSYWQKTFALSNKSREEGSCLVRKTLVIFETTSLSQCSFFAAGDQVKNAKNHAKKLLAENICTQ